MAAQARRAAPGRDRAPRRRARDARGSAALRPAMRRRRRSRGRPSGTPTRSRRGCRRARPPRAVRSDRGRRRRRRRSPRRRHRGRCRRRARTPSPSCRSRRRRRRRSRPAPSAASIVVSLAHLDAALARGVEQKRVEPPSLRHADHRRSRVAHDRVAEAEAQLDEVDLLLDDRRRIDRAVRERTRAPGRVQGGDRRPPRSGGWRPGRRRAGGRRA